MFRQKRNAKGMDASGFCGRFGRFQKIVFGHDPGNGRRFIRLDLNRLRNKTGGIEEKTLLRERTGRFRIPDDVFPAPRFAAVFQAYRIMHDRRLDFREITPNGDFAGHDDLIKFRGTFSDRPVLFFDNRIVVVAKNGDRIVLFIRSVDDRRKRYRSFFSVPQIINRVVRKGY